MTWLIVTYAALGYWHFWAVLRHRQPFDTPATIALNATLALTIGPPVLIGTLVLGGAVLLKES